MRTARTYLPSIYELHSLRWTIETGKERPLKRVTTSDVGPLGSRPADLRIGFVKNGNGQSFQCLRLLGLRPSVVHQSQLRPAGECRLESGCGFCADTRSEFRLLLYEGL